MVRLTYVPRDRKMTRQQWKAADRWLRETGRIVNPVALDQLQGLMIYGWSVTVVEDQVGERSLRRVSASTVMRVGRTQRLG